MNFQLATNDPQKILQLKNAVRGESVEVHMSSRGFTIDKKMYYDAIHLDQLVFHLESMIGGEPGCTKLSEEYSDDYIEFSMNELGQVVVSAEFFEHSDNDQHIQLEFVTDQTCLKGLLEEVKKWESPNSV